MAAVDPYEKAEKTKIKTRLLDGTNYQMVPFRLGTNEEYVNHIIPMICLVEQKDFKNSVEKAFSRNYKTRAGRSTRNSTCPRVNRKRTASRSSSI